MVTHVFPIAHFHIMYIWMRPETGIQGKMGFWLWLCDSGVWPETGTLRWSHHLWHCAQWGWLGPPDVVWGMTIWNGYSVGQPIILSAPIEVTIVVETLGYYMTCIRDTNIEWIREWRYYDTWKLWHYGTINDRDVMERWTTNVKIRGISGYLHNCPSKQEDVLKLSVQHNTWNGLEWLVGC